MQALDNGQTRRANKSANEKIAFSQIDARVKKMRKPANQVCGTPVRIFGTIVNLRLINGNFCHIDLNLANFI